MHVQLITIYEIVNMCTVHAAPPVNPTHEAISTTCSKHVLL